MFFHSYALEVCGRQAGSPLKKVDLADVTHPIWVGPGLSEPLLLDQHEGSLGVMEYLPK